MRRKNPLATWRTLGDYFFQKEVNNYVIILIPLRPIASFAVLSG